MIEIFHMPSRTELIQERIDHQFKGIVNNIKEKDTPLFNIFLDEKGKFYYNPELFSEKFNNLFNQYCAEYKSSEGLMKKANEEGYIKDKTIQEKDISRGNIHDKTAWQLKEELNIKDLSHKEARGLVKLLLETKEKEKFEKQEASGRYLIMDEDRKENRTFH